MNHLSIRQHKHSRIKRQSIFALLFMCLFFVSSNALANATYYTTDDNENNAGGNVADGDLDTLVGVSDALIHPIEFDINVSGALPITSAVLAIRADDVDPTETDQVSINGNYLGDLTGLNGLNSITLFNVPIGNIIGGDNLVEVDVDPTVGLRLQVDWGQLLIDGGAQANGNVQQANIINYSTTPGSVNIDARIDVNIVTGGTYGVEIQLVDTTAAIIYTDRQSFTGVGGTVNSRDFAIPYNLFADTGTYDIEIFLYHNDGMFDVLEQIDALSFNHVQGEGPKLPADPSTSTITATSGTLVANGVASTTITFQGIDVASNDLDTGGQTVLFSSSSGSLSSVNDNGDGTYTATLTAPTTVGTSIISATVDGEAVTDTATVTFVPGPASETTTIISLGVPTLFADGFSSTVVNVQTIDVFGNLLTSGGDSISLFTTSGNISVVSDQGDGTYTATLTASTDVVTATVTGTLNGFVITDNETINYIVGPASIITSTLTETLDNIYADGVTQSTITLQAIDIGNNNLSIGGDVVVINTSLGTISSTIDNGDGTYTATLRSETSAGTALVTAQINLSQVNDTVGITFTDIPTVNPLIINSATPTLTGTVSIIPGANFSILLDGQTYIPNDGNLSVSGNTWTLNIPNGNALTDGTYQVVASVTDVAAQVTNDATTDELEIDITPPTLVFDPLPNLDSDNTLNYNITGSCTGPNDSITITGIDAALKTFSAPTFTCSATGTFSTSVNFRTLADGPITIEAFMTDIAGNQTTVQTLVSKSACSPDNSTPACDSDGDTISDGYEELLGMNPNDPDSDSDGIGDEFEYGPDIDAEPVDTDGDGVPDVLDNDSDNDGILDSNETDGGLSPRDSDSDGIPDFQDLDSDGDYVPDTLEHTFGLTDADADTIQNVIDLDSDGDGIPDAIENGLATRIDTDRDGIDNAFDVDITRGEDLNLDGIDDNIEPLDTDHDGFYDMFDIDSDNDGLTDTLEAMLTGIADTDSDGIIDTFDVDFTGLTDLDGDNIDDSVTVLDSDGDSFPDHRDLDSDNDSYTDVVESDGPDSAPANGIIDNPSVNQGTTPSTPDSDSDGLPNYIDIESLNPFNNRVGPFDVDSRINVIEIDSSGDGLVDGTTDTDGDGILDPADETLFYFGSYSDHDNDGIPNLTDLDDDNDGILDALEGEGMIDSDGDGWADNADLDSDNDGVTDLFESQSGLLDANNDGIVDNFTDSNSDGVDDTADLNFILIDSDMDSIPDLLDLDSDGDNIFDLVEANEPDAIMTFLDSDNNGRIDVIVNQGSAVIFFNPVDTDLDNTVDMLDLDSDNDNILDYLENTDANNDGITDRVQAQQGEIETSIKGAGSINRFALSGLLLLGLLYFSIGLFRRVNRTTF